MLSDNLRTEHGPEYGIVGAGGVNAGLIGKLPRNAVALGPVGGVTFRVASRIANTLRAGWAVRSLDELNGVRLILFYSPPERLGALSAALAKAKIDWAGKSLIFCDCEPGNSADPFRASGASIAKLKRSALPGRLVIQGTAPALTFAARLARELNIKPAVIPEQSAALFDAALTLGSAGLTPVIDAVARALRQCGLREVESAQLAAALFAKTANDYAHSGKQSWQWHIEPPKAPQLIAQLDALDHPLKGLLAQLLVTGFTMVDRHGAVSRTIQDALATDKKASPAT